LEEEGVDLVKKIVKAEEFSMIWKVKVTLMLMLLWSSSHQRGDTQRLRNVETPNPGLFRLVG
jgi:hypothetical protein